MILALLLSGISLAAQEPQLRRIQTAEREFPEPFTRVSSLRELRDGRVIVADARDKTVQLLDFAAARATRVGREGAGPGEYALPQRLVALPGDTTLLYDPLNGRLLLILPDGTPGSVLRLPEAFNPGSKGGPRAADARGGFYYELSQPSEPGARYGSSAVDVVRFDRGTGRSDTLATLALPAGRFEGARTLPGGMLFNFTNKPLAPQDVAAYAADGRVAIVRAKDYRVEWIAPDGKRVTGAPIGYARIRIDAAERKAFEASQTRPGQIIVRPGAGAPPPSPGSGAAPRGGAVPIPRGSDPFADTPVEWPDYKPPFLSNAALVAPDGKLWVLTTRAHDDPVPRYDVIGPDGRLSERVLLPAGARLAGFGKGVLYLVRTDADDLEWLGRYRY